LLSPGIRSLLEIFWRHRRNVAPGILCLLVVDGAQLAIPLVVKGVVDEIVSRQVSAAWVGRQALVLLGLALTVALFRFFWRHFFFSTARRVEMELRTEILDHVLSLPSRFFTETRTGEVMALATNDVESIREAVAMGFVAGFDATVYALVAIVAMVALDPVLAFWTIIPLPFLAVLMLFSLKAIYSRWDAVQASFEAMTEKARESIAGVRVLRAYVQEEGDARDFERFSGDYYAKYLRYTRLDAMFHPTILAMAGACMALLLGVGGGRIIEGKTSVGSFVAFASYLGMLTWPMIAAGWMGSLIQRASASMDRIRELLREAPEVDAAPAGVSGVCGAVEARDLTFSYPGQASPAVEGLNFTLRAGGSVGIVGEVGSGKSTVAHLLCRIWDPPGTSLFLDGADILDLPLSVLRKSIAYVPQEAFLFSDTIEENLRVGGPDAPRAEIEAACAAAAFHDEVVALPLGYETLLGERGITLSGGQKQRLCLARALLKRAPILVLDDTLSAVDAGTESRILENLAKWAPDQTRVVVSHRVSAVRDLDEILVLWRGRVIQRGSHAALMAQEGFYREMAELQRMVEVKDP
jgi:ATP-binding cassette, subfamily B, multidrug efflux pump